MGETENDWRRRIEESKIGLDRRTAYLQEWQSNTKIATEQAHLSGKLAGAFAQIGIRSAYILNGGGLVALPPLMAYFSPDQTPRGAAVCALIFIIGLMLAAVSNYSAYASLKYAEESYWKQFEVVSTKVNLAYWPDEQVDAKRKASDESEGERKRLYGVALEWRDRGERSFFISLGAFAAGALGGLIALA